MNTIVIVMLLIIAVYYVLRKYNNYNKGYNNEELLEDKIKELSLKTFYPSIKRLAKS